ncbi:MAG: LamG domain-containing protein [Candidatus Micrarchaeota archaeon]|nr:LamG domain-containing protein [Candidatus Micrarchaeota archaeon]
MDKAVSGKLQSAMEYLMTYGWAMLAIAIVMVSLYSLGIFNAGSLQPTAATGACKVIRTAALTSLAGQCNGLIPRYVARFRGSNNWVQVPNSATLNITNNNITVAAWVYPVNSVNYMRIATKTYTGAWALNFQTNTYVVNFDLGKGGVSSGSVLSANSLRQNRWSFVVGTYNGCALSIYINGTLDNAATCYSNDLGTDTDPVYIGYEGGSPMNGSIANVQVYNTSLDPATIKAMYVEGIGGAPINLKNLVGWWPLNGDANDYSGNNNHGTPTNVIWNANWQSSYTQH